MPPKAHRPLPPERVLAETPAPLIADADATHAAQCARVCQGIREGEFSLAYQPIVDVRAGTAVGAEALLRWRHPQHGWLRPGAFAQVLHQPDVARAVTAFVIERIAADRAALPVAHRHKFVSFNAWPSQLEDGELERLVTTHYLARGGAPEVLMIELLESGPHVAGDELAMPVEALRKMGLKVAIDDLGCGAWTLLDLAHFEVDAVKLARELICRLPASDAAQHVVTGTLQILKALGTQAIVEGIETPEQVAWAATVPHLWAQGYAFARPMPDLAGAIGWAQSTAETND
ncbi:EAL domain-containing protein [Paraburkholderia sp.]|uniref:EAL domain-containing protein n=1 Tax=Paraburkholderia sp. TaxID=1926495 RepID=UPI0025D7CA34|nr:EAL domain-containing protein [Paraburkholderia sp.]